MLYQLILVIAVLALTSVLPTASRPRTQRLSRGPAWTNFQDLAVDKDAISTASQLRNDRRSIAIIAAAEAGKTTSDAADVAAEVIRPGLQYSNQLIVVDAATSESLFSSTGDRADVRAKAQQAGVDIVVLVRTDATNKTMSLEVVSTTQDSPTKLDPVRLDNLTDAIIDASVQARRTLLEAVDAIPAQHAEQLDRRPQANFVALQHLIMARRQLASVVTTTDASKRAELCKQALTSADHAIEASPNFLEAYVIKASCQDELDQTVDLNRTLTLAFQKSNPSEHDLLTLLEIKGDYTRFVRTNPEESLNVYQALLETDPTNLTGLWTTIDILLSGDGISAVDEDSIAAAATYAARLVALHPNSGVGRAITANQNE